MSARLRELVERLCAPGHIGDQISASEGHEIRDEVLELLGRLEGVEARLAAAQDASHGVDLCHGFRCTAAYLQDSRARARVVADHPECDCGLRALVVALRKPTVDHNGSSFGSDP